MENKIYSVLVVEDNPYARFGIAEVLSENHRFRIVGETQRDSLKMDLIHELHPDLIIIDSFLPVVNGISLPATIKKEFPEVKILVFMENIHLSHMLSQSGVDGCIVKESTLMEFTKSLEDIVAGQRYYCSKIADSLLKERLPSKPVSGKDIAEPRLSDLSPREQEVLILIAEGYTVNKIAGKLAISKDTARSHRESILRKLCLKGTVGLTRFALKYGLVSIPAPSRFANSAYTVTPSPV